MKNLLIFLLILCSGSSLIGQNRTAKEIWVDSVFNSLDDEEKISQLMMLRAYSNKGADHQAMITELITKNNIGGLCFFQGGPERQKQLTKYYQNIAKTPLLIAIDAEWGLGMRLDSSFSFPYQLSIGAANNNDLIYQMGSLVAEEMHELGIHINFAPVVDINNNPQNPVINSRSFGEDKENVSSKAIAYMKGMQDHGILAVAKHFPGHGDTDSDSHYTLPMINHDFHHLDSVELYPFKQLIDEEIKGIMTAHLFIPALDSTENLPTTLSPKVVSDLLEDSLGFEGLKITDALDMKGVTSFYKPGEIELKALLAGQDILLLPQDVQAAIEKITAAVKEGILKQKVIDEKCRKVLEAKYDAIIEISQNTPVETGISKELVSRNIFKESITVLKNKDSILPIQNLQDYKIAVLSIGSPELTAFQKNLKKYTTIDFYNTEKKITSTESDQLKKQLEFYDLVLISLHNTSIFPHRNFGISESSLKLIQKISNPENSILTLFASPYALKFFNPEDFKAIVLAYEDKTIAQEVCAQIIMGALNAKGKLPVSVNEFYHSGDGQITKDIQRLEYSIPEDAGLQSDKLLKIDSIVLKCIKDEFFPGCQIIIGKDGKVVYEKSFGYHTYNKGNFVHKEDLYDLASITKIAATTLSVMKLSDEKKIDIDQRLSTYLPYTIGTNKEKIIIREMMAHQSKLQAWIPFYLDALDQDGLPDKNIFSRRIKDGFSTRVCDKLYISNDYSFAMIDSILSSELMKKKEYKYSDLGYYFLKQIIENASNQPFEKYVSSQFYQPLGLQSMGFNPLKKNKLKEIVPTENDTYFRNELIHGFVHDPGAAMLGGVAGHAGLFSNANDMAILSQMLLQKGYYGGHRYIKPETIEEFTKQQFPLNDNRRGIGFDKPITDDKELVPGCKYVSDNSFGHSGFTGTYFWCDPDFNLFYVFLSNRIHPSAENRKLISENIRPLILEVVYESFFPEDESISVK